VYTDPEAEPNLFVFIAASIHADDRFICSVLETVDASGADLKRRFDAALTVSNLPIRYDGPDTFAANKYE
jgi:hypothetical protein